MYSLLLADRSKHFAGRIFLVMCLLLILSSGHLFGQKTIKLKQADNMKGGKKDGESFQRVIGDVIFVQSTTTIYCDSAIFFKKKNSMQAFGHIRITEGDSVSITARGLNYNGDTKIAYLRRNVVFVKKGQATLYTDFLDFDRLKNEARYFNGGKLVDSTNTLTSDRGYLDLRNDVASFKKDVVLVNPENSMKADTLQYNSKTGVIYFLDKTTVTGKDGETGIYQNGIYDTKQKRSSLNKGDIETLSYKMSGLQYFLDEAKKFYKVVGKVVMTSKEENIIIHGNEGNYDKQKGITKVFGNPYVTRVDNNSDTLFISADTLVSVENEDPKKKRLLAYHHVKIFRHDLQGKADSLVYSTSDSTIYFFSDPVLWTSGNQMTADSIRVRLKGKSIDKIYLVANSFVISEDTMKNYNQIKGRKMVANFDGQSITHVNVQGNGESLYHILQDAEKEKPLRSMGMNKIICSNMKINFLEGKVNNISFYIKPDASFTPPHELLEEEKRLKGFKWRKEERPDRKDVVKN